MNRLAPHIYFGLDLGRRRDRSALAVLERIHVPTGELDPVTWERKTALYFVLRHIELFRLGVPYLEIVRRMERLPVPPATGHPYARDPERTLVVDATGVGAPVVEALHAAHLPARIVAVTITGAGASHPDTFGGVLVPRRDLLSNLRMLMERALLRIAPPLARGPFAEELLRVTDRSGNAHDDRVLAVALAAWQATRGLAQWLADYTPP